MTMSGLSDDFLSETVVALETQLAERTRQYQEALKKIQGLERITSRAALLATEVAYLCSTLPEASVDIEQAANQLHNLLVNRIITS